MGLYVDGYVIPVPRKNVASYKKMAQLGKKVWMEYGALSYVEAVGDDINVKYGIPFGKLLKLKPSETVIFAFVTYKSKTDRNRIVKKVMTDPRMDPTKWKTMPFDDKRMTFGGFKGIVVG